MGFQAEPNEDTQIYIKVSSRHLPPPSQHSYAPGLEDVKSTTKYFSKSVCMTGRQTSRENQLLNLLHNERACRDIKAQKQDWNSTLAKKN